MHTINYAALDFEAALRASGTRQLHRQEYDLHAFALSARRDALLILSSPERWSVGTTARCWHWQLHAPTAAMTSSDSSPTAIGPRRQSSSQPHPHRKLPLAPSSISGTSSAAPRIPAKEVLVECSYAIITNLSLRL